jgi:phosphoribosylanthranilate isomerase
LTVVRVKICGITRVEDVHLAVKFGADALGFVYGYEGSKRKISSFESLKSLVSAVPPYVSSVVVIPTSNPELLDVILKVKPNFIQIANDDRADFESEIVVRKIRADTGFDSFIQTVHLAQDKERASQEKIIERCKTLSRFSKAILLDSKTSIDNGLLGGTGVTHDWQLSRKVRDILRSKPIILAGGLTKSNVSAAIKIVEPYAVDVSTGVEKAPGIKDAIKVEEFTRTAKWASNS